MSDTNKQFAWEPKFDAISHVQEHLAIRFCNEIAGPKGGKPLLPDPVRLLEMAEALYLAERNAALSPPSVSVNVQSEWKNAVAEACAAAEIPVDPDPVKAVRDLVIKSGQILGAFAVERDRATLPPAVQVPDGWKLVPIEPTPEMVAATFNTKTAGEHTVRVQGRHRAALYRKMIAAVAPTATQVDKIKFCHYEALSEALQQESARTKAAQESFDKQHKDRGK